MPIKCARICLAAGLLRPELKRSPGPLAEMRGLLLREKGARGSRGKGRGGKGRGGREKRGRGGKGVKWRSGFV